MESKKLALLCRELADNKKAENLVILDLTKLPGVTDYMVLCSGTSDPHLRAIEEEISHKLRDDHQVSPRAVDGSRNSGWIVLDFFDVIVHLMKPDVREHYDLEGLWNDAGRLRSAARKAAAQELGGATKPKVARKRATPKKAAKKAAATDASA